MKNMPHRTEVPSAGWLKLTRTSQEAEVGPEKVRGVDSTWWPSGNPVYSLSVTRWSPRYTSRVREKQDVAMGDLHPDTSQVDRLINLYACHLPRDQD